MAGPGRGWGGGAQLQRRHRWSCGLAILHAAHSIPRQCHGCRGTSSHPGRWDSRDLQGSQGCNPQPRAWGAGLQHTVTLGKEGRPGRQGSGPKVQVRLAALERAARPFLFLPQPRQNQCLLESGGRQAFSEREAAAAPARGLGRRLGSYPGLGGTGHPPSWVLEGSGALRLHCELSNCFSCVPPEMQKGD